MTDGNRQPLSFSSLGSKSVVADFLGGRFTSDAWALLLREVGQKIGLFEALDQAIPDPRNPVCVVHDQDSMIVQRVVAIARGYEDLNDHQTLRNHQVRQVAAWRVPDLDPAFASPPTLCRLENRIARRTLVRIAGVLVDQFFASHAQLSYHIGRKSTLGPEAGERLVHDRRRDLDPQIVLGGVELPDRHWLAIDDRAPIKLTVDAVAEYLIIAPDVGERAIKRWLVPVVALPAPASHFSCHRLAKRWAGSQSFKSKTPPLIIVGCRNTPGGDAGWKESSLADFGGI
jgi:hypothetical protein